MAAFSDYLDLRTAVVEQVGAADYVDVFPRHVQMAETEFSRRLRTQDQIAEISVTVVGGFVALPDDFAEVLSLTSKNGVERVGMGLPAYKSLRNTEGFFAVSGGNIFALDGTYTLTYYAKIPTISGSTTATNWLLEKHPELYLYGVSQRVFARMQNLEGVAAMRDMKNDEIMQISEQDFNERHARSRVRVKGHTP